MGQAACCQEEVDRNDDEDGFVHSFAHSSGSGAGDGCAPPYGALWHETTEIYPLGEAKEEYSVPEATFSGHEDEFTIRVDRTSGQGLGVDVRHENGTVLVVSEVAAGGLLRRWNDGHPGAALHVGDRIVAVNGVRGDAMGMMAECEKKRALEFAVQRRAHAASEAVRAATLAKHAALWVEDAYRMMGADPMCGLKFADVAGQDTGRPGEDLQARKSRRVCVTVHRDSVNDALGVHFKHVKGKLLLVGILSHGAVHRSSAQSQVRGCDTLEAGDIIVQINDVRDDDAAMVQECKVRATLVIHALRHVG
jgi:hypothetical protein